MDLLTWETIIKWGLACGIVGGAMMGAACYPSNLPPVSNGPAEAIDLAQDFTPLVRQRQSVGVVIRRRLGRLDLPRCRVHEEGQTPG
jgi:hypothetical protein